MEQLTQHDPRRIGPFEVLARLGAGGMGLVYLARSASGRRVAIKTVRAELAEDQLFRVRFTREVEAARAVSGFYTAAVVDADPRAAVPWLATAYVPAPSLEEIVERCGPLPVQAVRWLAAGVAEALQSIHGAGLVHRDLKPSNVLVVEDGPRVIDFGIASGVSNTRLTMTNVAVGTPAYMSPEQARDSRSVTGSSDVFSLGSTLTFAATGHAPYHGGNPVETVFMLLREGPDLAGLPEELRSLVESCLKMQPENRPSPADLQARLAPHLFSSDDDGSEASAWLPDEALGLIESRRGRRQSAGAAHPAPHRPQGLPYPQQPPPPHGQQPHAGAQYPAHPHHPGHQAAPHQAPDHQASALQRAPDRGAPQDQRAPRHQPPQGQPNPQGPPRQQGQPEPHRRDEAGVPEPRAPRHPSAPPRQDTPLFPASPAPPELTAPLVRDDRHGPVQLPGSQVAIGPGPRAGDGSDHGAPPVAGTDWVRRAGTAGLPAVRTEPHSALTAPAPAAPAPAPAPASAPGASTSPLSPSASGQAAPTGPLTRQPWRPWRFRMSNDVWGTPAVFQGRLYVSSFEVHVLDVATGRREFRTRDVAWTMTLAEGRVHASDGPSLYALDAGEGGELWRAAPDGWVYSIQVDGGSVCTGTRGGGVQLWDAATGELRWQKTGAQSEFESPESGPSVTGNTVYYFAGGRLHSVDALSGRPRWSYVLGEPAPARPVEADGAVYVTAGTRVLALDAASGGERWRFDAPAVMFTPPVRVPGAGVTGGGIYVVDYLGTVYAIDASTGRDRWRVATESRQGNEPVVVEAGTVHLGSGKALYTLDAVSGTPRWRFAAQGEIAGRPVVADGRVHFGSKDHCLYTVDAAGGQLRWKLETGGEITGSPVVADGVVYACSNDRCVYALDAVKGTGTGRAAAGRN